MANHDLVAFAQESRDNADLLLCSTNIPVINPNTMISLSEICRTYFLSPEFYEIGGSSPGYFSEGITPLIILGYDELRESLVLTAYGLIVLWSTQHV